MTRHEKIDPDRRIGFDEPGAAFDAVAEGRMTAEEAQAVLRRAIEQSFASGEAQEPRTLEAIKAEGRRRLASLRGQ